MFAYVATGVPQSYITLSGADSGTRVFPPPPTLTTGAEPPPSSAQQSNATAAAAGVFIPISQQLVVGARVVVAARFWAGELPGPLAPSAHIYLLGVDQRNAAVDRLYWAWQLLLPTDGTPLEGCVPPAGAQAGAAEGSEPLVLVGPVGAPTAAHPDGAVVAVTCGGASGSSAAFTAAFGVAVGSPDASAPSLLWSNASWAGAGAGSGDGRAAPPTAPPFSAAAGPPSWWAYDSTPPPGAGALLLLAPNASVVARVDAGTGAVTSAHDMVGALGALGGDLCALGLPMTAPGAAFTPTGPALLAAAPGGGGGGGAGGVLLVPAAAAASGKPLFPRFWLAAFAFGAAAEGEQSGGVGAPSVSMRALWCVPSPGNSSSLGPGAGPGDRPVAGQLVLLAAGGAPANASAVVGVPMPEGVYGLAERVDVQLE